MDILVRRYIDSITDIDIRSDRWDHILNKIADNNRSSKRKIYSVLTPEKYHEFVDKIGPRMCDELIAFFLVVETYKLYNCRVSAITKKVFFNKVQKLFIDDESDTVINISHAHKSNYNKLLNNENVNGLEKLLFEIHTEMLLLIELNLFI